MRDLKELLRHVLRDDILEARRLHQNFGGAIRSYGTRSDPGRTTVLTLR
jgi:hypothetical protein